MDSSSEEVTFELRIEGEVRGGVGKESGPGVPEDSVRMWLRAKGSRVSGRHQVGRGCQRKICPEREVEFGCGQGEYEKLLRMRGPLWRKN